MVKRLLFFVFAFFAFSASVSALDVSDEITQAYIRFDSGAWQSVHSDLPADLLTYDDSFQVSSSIDILIPVSVPADSIVARFDFLTRSASFGTFSVDYGTFYDSVYRPRTDPLQYTFVSANRLDYSGGSHLFSRSVQVFCSSMSTTNVYWFVGFHWSGSKVTLVTTQSIGSVVASASSTDSISLSGDWASIPASSSFSGSSPISLSPGGNGLVKSSAVGGLSLSPSRSFSDVSVDPVNTGFNSTTQIFKQSGEYFYLTPTAITILKAGYSGTVANPTYSTKDIPAYASYIPAYSGNIDMSGTLPNYNNSATVSGDSPDYSVSGKVQTVNSVYPFSFTATRASDDSEAVAQLKRANSTLDVVSKNLQTITDDYTAREDVSTDLSTSASQTNIDNIGSDANSGGSSLISAVGDLSVSSVSTGIAPFIAFMSTGFTDMLTSVDRRFLDIFVAVVLLLCLSAYLGHIFGWGGRHD